MPGIKIAIEKAPHGEIQLIGAYVPSEYKALIIKIARNRQESLSTFMRRAILKELAGLGYLDEETRQSLGGAVANE